jgi:hypothetical protein
MAQSGSRPFRFANGFLSGGLRVLKSHSLKKSQDPCCEPSAFDIVPGEAGNPLAFPSEQWAIDMSSEHHFKLAFDRSYPVGSMWNLTAFTLIRPEFQSGDEEILVAFSDNHGSKKRETVKSCHLAPAPVRKVERNLKVVVLYGERKGQIFEVGSTNKKREICKLRLEDRKQCEELWYNICIVMPHAPEYCQCTQYPI